MGIRQTFGLYLTPMSLNLGVGRETFALSMGLLNLVWGLAAPLAGIIADKYGSSRVITFGALAYTAGLIMLARASDGTDLLSAGIVIGLGVSGTGFTAVLGTVGRAVPEAQRGAALGFVSMGGSIGQFAALPMAHNLIAGLGWTGSLIAMAALSSILALAGIGLAGKQQTLPSHAHEGSAREAFSTAISHPGFLLLTAGFFVCGFHIAFVAVHLPALLQDKGFTPWIGAAALTIVGFANIIGTYLCGRASEFMEQRVALSILYLARAGLFLLLLFIPLSETMVFIFAACIGLLWLGTIPLTSGLVATLFGPRWMSMLFGIVFLSHQVGAFFGAWLGGRIYDATQSYELMWWILIGLGIAAAGLHWPISEKPVRELAANPEHR